MFLFKSGSAENIKLSRPYHVIAPGVTPFPVKKKYCDDPRDRIEIKKYLHVIQRLNLDRFNYPTCNFYGNVYSTILFLSGLSYVGDIVLLDPSLGALANIIAEKYKVRVHFFSPKKTVKLHPLVKHYKRIITEEDCNKLQGRILVSFTIFALKTDFSAQGLYETRYKLREFNKRLLILLKPSAYLILQKAENIEEKIYINGAAKIIFPPFYFQDMCLFFLLQKEYTQSAIPGFKELNLQELNIDLFLFNYCKRNTIKNGLTYDTEIARRALKIFPNLEAEIGAVPIIKKNKPIPSILLNGENNKYISFMERKNIQRSIFSAFVEDVKLVHKTVVPEIFLEQYRLVRGNINYIWEPRMRFLTKVVWGLRLRGQKFLFYNNFEYFREFAFLGEHIFYPEIPNQIQKFNNKFLNLNISVTNLESRMDTGQFILTTDFMELLDELVIVIKKDLPFLKDIAKLFIDPCPVLEQALIVSFPRLRIEKNTELIKPGDWYFRAT